MKIVKSLILILAAAAGVTVAAEPLFEDVTAAAGFSGPGSRNGATWADLDNDGWPDLIVQGRIWRNLQGKGFAEITKDSGITQPGRFSVAADFNGDGHIDLVFPSHKDTLWLGDGKGHFTPGEMTSPPNLKSQGAAAADFDGDGWVDLYVSSFETWKPQKSFPDFRYRNNQGKLELAWTAEPHEIMRGRCAVAADFNNDGAVDIYVGNYRLQPNFLWVNDGKGNFVNRAREYGAAGSERPGTTFSTDYKVKYNSSGHTISALWGDFDNDGWIDLFVGNFSHPPKYQDRAQFLQNGGPEKQFHFIDRSADAKLTWQESYSGSAAADYDNDGRLDLFFATVYKNDKSRLFHNEGDWRFKEVPEAGGAKSALTYQVAWADYDNDGRMDLFTAGKLYRNVGPAGNYLRLRLTDRAPNTAAVGAVVKISGNGVLPQMRQVEAGTGSGCQNESTIHFGLGGFTGETMAQVRWPDGTTESFPNLKSNTYYQIVRGGKPEVFRPAQTPGK